jgi:predicted transcriptional regulator
MTREQLVKRVKARRETVGVTVENLSKLAKVGYRTVARFFAGEDVRISTIEKVTEVLGVDLAGNEIIDLKILKEKRAEEKAKNMVSLVQDTSALEMQGLETNALKSLIEETKKQFLTGAYKDKLWAV